MPTLIFAHRGYSAKYPENTLPAFKAAISAGAHGIELDVQLSKDGVPVVIHDETLHRTTSGKGFVKDYALKDLQALKIPYRIGLRQLQTRIPALAEVLELLSATGVILNIELKNQRFPYPGMIEKVLKMIHDYKMSNRTIYSSFEHDSLIKVKHLDKNAETAPLYKRPIPEPWKYARALGAKGIHPQYRGVTPGLINEMHERNLYVRAYTVNQPSAIKRLIQWHIDGIMTDDPVMALKCLK